jgi:hypothetical protein
VGVLFLLVILRNTTKGSQQQEEEEETMRRTILLGAALAISLSAASVVLVSGGEAWAATKITCTTVTGSIFTGASLSGCSGGNTGGSSGPISLSTFEFGGTIQWVSGSTTTIATPTAPTTSAKKCPGYVKSSKKHPYSGTEPSAEKFSGQVTADTGDGVKVPGKFTGAVCVSPSGNFSTLKAPKVT